MKTTTTKQHNTIQRRCTLYNFTLNTTAKCKFKQQRVLRQRPRDNSDWLIYSKNKATCKPWVSPCQVHRKTNHTRNQSLVNVHTRQSTTQHCRLCTTQTQLWMVPSVFPSSAVPEIILMGTSAMGYSTLSVAQATVSEQWRKPKHWPQTGNIRAGTRLIIFFIHHMTPNGRANSLNKLALQRQVERLPVTNMAANWIQ